VQLILWVIFGEETRYMRGQEQTEPPSFVERKFHFRRIDPKPLRLWDFIQPLRFVLAPCIFLPAVSYAMVFLFASVMITIEIPQLFVEKFHFNTQQVGLQNLSIIIGSLIGEQVGGIMSDQWMLRRKRYTGKSPQPEFRLWLSYIGYVLAICGVVIFLVRIEQANSHWNITPIIGAAIAAVGNQIVTTVLITYAVDCDRPEAASIGVFITFVRQAWGFIGPFWYV